MNLMYCMCAKWIEEKRLYQKLAESIKSIRKFWVGILKAGFQALVLPFFSRCVMKMVIHLYEILITLLFTKATVQVKC